HPDWELDDVRAAIGQLAEAGHVEDLGAPLPAGLTAAEAERDRSSRDFFSWIDPAPRPSPHEVLARVRRGGGAPLGAGAAGSAGGAGGGAGGVGALHCVDLDGVEETTLTRQLLYVEADVGRPKVEAAVERLTALNSAVTVTGQSLQVRSPDDLEPLMAPADAF